MTLYNLEEHHAFVQRHGEKILWRRSSLCPCGGPDASRARPTCTICNGIGIAYAAQKELTGIVTGVERQKDLLISGMVEPGDMMFGLSPYETEQLTPGDIIELTKWTRGQPFEGEILERSVEGDIDRLAYKAASVYRCFSVDIETDTVAEYQAGVDFTVSGNQLTWVSGRPQPAPGSFYSIKYGAVFEWVVFRPPGDRFEGAVNLGQRVFLRQRHLVVK